LSVPDKFASIWNVTFAVCDSVNVICTCPVEVSDGEPKFWFEPLFGHSIAAPPEAAPSFTTTKGANRLCPDRLSSSTTRLVPPEVLLEDELLELELLEDEDELDDELEELLLDEDEELLELEDELLDELEDELLELEELLPVPPSPAQVGAAKLPS
jgi:hypothetical protein